ncbi:CbtB domain-containing protein [Streptomyces sp. NPDC001761]
MPHPPLSAAGDSLAVTVRPLRDAAVIVTAVALALLALYAVFLDQGQLLSPVLGKVATSANYLHEFAHDGRHLLGAPCH